MSRAIRPFESRDFDRVHQVCVAAFTSVHEGFEQALGAEIFAREYPGWQARNADDIRGLLADPNIQVHVVEESWGNDNVFRTNRATVNAAGYGFRISEGATGTVVACSNMVTGAGAGLSNIGCKN